MGPVTAVTRLLQLPGYCGYQVTFGQVTMINVVTRLLWGWLLRLLRLLRLPGYFWAGYHD